MKEITITVTIEEVNLFCALSVVNKYTFRIEKEIFYLGSGREPGTLTTELSRTSTDPCQNFPLIVILSGLTIDNLCSIIS